MVVFSPSAWPFWVVVVVFLVAAAVIALLGIRMSKVADQLADVTGLGEAIVGAVFVGATTSLSGTVTSVTAAYQGFPQLSVSNSIGGIAAQTTFLAIADMTYRKVNLEHAAASVQNLMQGALLSTLLAIPLIAMAGPELTFFGVHPASLALFAAYAFGIRLIHQTGAAPLWDPTQTPETREDVPEETSTLPSARGLWTAFALLAVGVSVAGYAVAQTGVQLSARTGLTESVVGAFFTAVATSLPELVVAVAAVRRGALTLAVGNVIGGNTFDVLFLAFSDIAFRGGSIYHAITFSEVYIIALSILLAGILLLGLLRREKTGIGNIGFESFLVLVLYGMAVVVLVSGG